MCVLGLRHYRYASACRDCFLRFEMSRMEHNKMSTPKATSSIWTATILEWSFAAPLAVAPNKCVFLRAFESLTTSKRSGTGSMSDTFFRHTSKQVNAEWSQV